MGRSIVRLGMKWTVAGAFTWSGIAKLLVSHSVPATSTTMFDSVFGHRFGAGVAFSIMELSLAAWLLSGFMRQAALLVALALLSAFSGAIAFETKRPNPRPCGCFGAPVAAIDPETVRKHLWIGLGINLVLMAGAYTLAATPGKREST